MKLKVIQSGNLKYVKSHKLVSCLNTEMILGEREPVYPLYKKKKKLHVQIDSGPTTHLIVHARSRYPLCMTTMISKS